MSLSIFRALATECRRDVSLLTPSLLASVNVTLTALSSDLEVTARTASVVSLQIYHGELSNAI
jgi:protein EFR3